MNFLQENQFDTAVPEWIPTAARRYLRHVEQGVSLRDVAKAEGCHPSTILRQVRRYESLRDDPLIDEALDGLGQLIQCRDGAACPSTDSFENKGLSSMNAIPRPSDLPDEETLAREARRILRRLCETGAVLVLAPDLGKAAVLRQRDEADAPPVRTAIVDRDVAKSFALRDWIACKGKGKVARYTITNAGRAALKRYLAEDANRRRQEIDPATTPFMAQHVEWAERVIGADEKGGAERKRVNVAESPLTMLARRKDADGKPFLGPELVQAGERFREDFELAHMGPRLAQNWDRFLTTGDRGAFGSDSGLAEGPRAARARVRDALDDLGPGLGDIIMRCCCFLEGLEAAEKRMGWSARSGKIVLRIALQRLHRHYVEKHGSVSAVIG